MLWALAGARVEPKVGIDDSAMILYAFSCARIKFHVGRRGTTFIYTGVLYYITVVGGCVSGVPKGRSRGPGGVGEVFLWGELFKARRRLHIRSGSADMTDAPALRAFPAVTRLTVYCGLEIFFVRNTYIN